MKKKPAFAVVAVLFAIHSVLATPRTQASTLPPNDLHLEDDIARLDANIDEAEFNSIIDKAMAFYVPLAKEHGGNLSVERLWENKMVNASALRMGPIWKIYMYGGLARRPEVTPDGFQVVVCHELGHLFGGFPFYRTIFGGLVWFSVEGESDYFATQSCARELWKHEHEQNAVHRVTVDFYAQQRCDMTWSGRRDRDLCYRIADASASLAKLLATPEKGEKPSFATPSRESVARTSRKHPKAQCRLDTYFEGALCPENRDPSIIPAKRLAGYFGTFFNRRAEKQAASQSCHSAEGYFEGVRPRCWFAPVWMGEQ